MFSKNREQLGAAQRWVVKIGSAMITNEGRGLDNFSIDAWVAQMAELHQSGRELLLVTSGAVAEGMKRLGWRQRPTTAGRFAGGGGGRTDGLGAGVGIGLAHHGIQTAQVLLTHEDAADRQRYLNIRNTLRTCCGCGWCRSSMKTTRWPSRKSALAITIRWARWWRIWWRQSCT
jgi:glutamate 5-kinase